MGEFILLLFIFFIVIPIGRVLFAVFRMRATYKRAMNNARKAQEQARNEYQSQHRSGGWSMPRRKKAKKVNPNAGEYIEWEEIEVQTSKSNGETHSSTAEKTTRYFEERISDAEWEEIKTPNQK